jgi:nucleoside-diphosphate-sugar epimerase
LEEEVMGHHVIVGAGPVGTATAQYLMEMGHEVTVVTRSGTGPDGTRRVAADAADQARLIELSQGAEAIYNCANPRYHRWPEDWPPIARAVLEAAEKNGAGLVTMSNLYGYGPVDGPMTEDLPLAATTVKGGVRARMWHEALAAHQDGRVRITEARGSDFVGNGARSVLSEVVLPRVRAGRRAFAPVDFDLPHSLTYTGDAGRLLAVLGTDDRSWGRAWHVPTGSATTLRDAARLYAELAGARTPRLTSVPTLVIRGIGLTDPEIAEVVEMAYQFRRPFVLDSTAAQETFGLRPTPLADALRTLL